MDKQEALRILEEIEEFISLGQTALQGVSKNDKTGIGKIKDLKHVGYIS